MPRVAVVGCGRMGKERARAASRAGAEVIALVDSDRARAQSVAQEQALDSGRVFGTAHELDWNRIDAVFVCTPPVDHDIATQAAARGIAVFIEKPLSIDYDSASRLAGMIEGSGVVNAVGYMNRYREGLSYARALLKKQSVLGYHGMWAASRYGVSWWSDPARSGGPFNEQATHLVDLARYLAGEVIDVAGSRSRDDSTVGTVLQFQNGAIGTLLYTCEAPAKTIALSVVTRAGSLTFNGWNFALAENTIDGKTFEGMEDPFQTETRAFLDAIRTGDRSAILSDVSDAAQTQRVVDEIRNRTAVLA